MLCTASCSSYLENLQNACDNCSYTAKYYEQDISDDGYTLIDTETETGKAGDDAVYDTKTYTGFYLDTAKTGTATKIASGGGTVVSVYYDRDEVTLTFYLAGGTTAATFAAATGTGGTLTGRYGAAVTMADPVKTGYMFAGWNPELPGTFPAEDATYTAKWTREGDYSITYVLDGGTNSMANPAGYNVETATIILADPTKTGYAFAGWYSSEDFSGNAVTEITQGSTGSITLYAKWTAGTGTAYTVQYRQQDISDDNYTLADTENLTGTTGAALAYTTSAKTYTGFTYDNTLTKINGTVSTTGTIHTDGSTMVILYYTRNTVTLTFDLAGGTTAATFTAATGTGGTLTGRYGAAVTMADPVKTGYTFAGWSPTLPGTFPASDASYTAKWTTENTAAITFVSGSMGVSVDGTTCTAVPPETGDWTYCWYFNGTKLSAASNTCTINTADLAPGYYELTVTTEIHGVTWLATCRVTVE
jgi:uncharacterized repeat protein (TIGR02543 family)